MDPWTEIYMDIDRYMDGEIDERSGVDVPVEVCMVTGRIEEEGWWVGVLTVG